MESLIGIKNLFFKKRLEVISKVLQVIDQSGEIELDVTTPECKWIIEAIIFIFRDFDNNSREIFAPDIVIIENKEIRCWRLYHFQEMSFSIRIDDENYDNIITCGFFSKSKNSSYINPYNTTKTQYKCTLVWLPNRCRVREVFEILDLFDEENLIDIVLYYLKFKHL